MARHRVEGKDEALLIERARNGDADAFADLVRMHQDEMYTLALRLTGSPDQAREVTQEALIRAWRALPKFRGDAALSTWLYRITVNTAWTLRRKAKRHIAASLESVPEREDESYDQPQRMAESTDMRPRLRAALAQLSPALRAVVVMKEVYDWSHREIADELGITVTTAKVRLHRGRKALQKLLEGEV